MKKILEFAGWKTQSSDDGPGIRSVLFLQGCSKHCVNCHNSRINEHGKGIIKEINEIVDFIDERCFNKKITISGGEPLEQKENLIDLLRHLKEKNYNICLYTGWLIEDIPEEIFKYIDYIKTGGFISELAIENIQYVGSSNQKMYKVENNKLEELNLAIN